MPDAKIQRIGFRILLSLQGVAETSTMDVLAARRLACDINRQADKIDIDIAKERIRKLPKLPGM